MKRVSIAIALFGIVWAGCHAESRKAKVLPLQAVEMRPYVISDTQILQNSKLFLWKEPLDAKTVETVLRAAKKMDDSEDNKQDCNTKRNEISSEIAKETEKMLEQASSLEDSVREDLSKLVDREKDRATLNPDDKERAAELDAEIAQLKNILSKLGEGIQKRHDSILNLCARLSEISALSIQASAEAVEALTKIKENTEFPDEQPERISVVPEGAGFRISIVDWLQKGRTLSTNDGSVRDVRYEVAGGVLRFEVVTDPGREFYRVKVSRTRPEIVDPARIYYQGDLERYHWDGTLERRGVAKLATSND